MSTEITQKDLSATALWVMSHQLPDGEEDAHETSIDGNDNVTRVSKRRTSSAPVPLDLDILKMRAKSLGNQQLKENEIPASLSSDKKEKRPSDKSSSRQSDNTIKLQVKHSKNFSLKKFDVHNSIHSSQGSLNSYESNSVSYVSSFVSLRPKLPESILLDRSFRRSSSAGHIQLKTPTLHPNFENLMKALDRGQGRAVQKQISGSKPVGSVHSSDSSDSSGVEDDEPTALPFNRQTTIREKRQRRTLPITLPSSTHVNEQQEATRLLSNDSLIDSTDGRDEEEINDNLKGRSESFKYPPAVKHKTNNRQYKSEPFGNGKPFKIIDGHRKVIVSKSSPAISNQCKSPLLKPLHEDKEQSSLQDEQADLKRRAIVEEIVSTEDNYVRNLVHISQAIKKIRDGSVLEERSLFHIFHNIRITEIKAHHSFLLHALNSVLVNWDPRTSCIGKAMFDTFQSETLHDNYLSYVENFENSKELIKQHLARSTAFLKFNEKFKHDNPSGHDLNGCLSIPANRLTSYKSLLERYLACTPPHHDDCKLVPNALRIIHGVLDRVGKIDNRGKQTTLRELERILDVDQLVAVDREFLRVDSVKVPNRSSTAEQGQTQDYSLWMFTDLLIITINKMPNRQNSRKDSVVVHGLHGQDIVPGHRRFHKFYKRMGLDDVEVINSPESEVRRYQKDYEEMTADLRTLEEIEDKINQLHTPHAYLSSNLEDLMSRCKRGLQNIKSRQESTDMASLRLNFQSSGTEQLKVIFKDQKTRSMWETDLISTKLNLEAVNTNKLPPLYVERIPIDVARAGMQLTCAAGAYAVSESAERQVWICNSDSSSGQVCKLRVTANSSTLLKQPPLNCSSKINCVCATPPYTRNSIITPEHSAPGSPLNTRLDTRSSLMWTGCEDGKLFISSIEHEKMAPISLKFAHSVTNMVYEDGKIFISISNGRLLIYKRDRDGLWDLDTPHSIQLNTASSCQKIIAVSCKLWSASNNEITIIDPILEQAERSIKICKDSNSHVQALAASRQGIVAVAIHSSCRVKLFHSTTLKQLTDLNISPVVAQKLSKADEIIKQHKTACLRVTTLKCCKDTLWIGTTAGVIITCRLPKLIGNICMSKDFSMPPVELTALDIGHTGNVRFIVTLEKPSVQSKEEKRKSVSRQSLLTKTIVISGGDGYEVLETSSNDRDSIGFNDSINHLLTWTV